MLVGPRRHLKRWPPWMLGAVRPLFHRWIGAGIGCDFDTVIE